MSIYENFSTILSHERKVTNMKQISKYQHCFKAGYTLIVSRILTCLCTISWTISWDCDPITIHLLQYRDFVHLWFCEKLDEYTTEVFQFRLEQLECIEHVSTGLSLSISRHVFGSILIVDGITALLTIFHKEMNTLFSDSQQLSVWTRNR